MQRYSDRVGYDVGVVADCRRRRRLLGRVPAGFHVMGARSGSLWGAVCTSGLTSDSFQVI